MDEATANRILEDYLAGRASEADLEQALDFLKDRANFDAGLAALFNDLDLPGGISHETAQEIMPYYLEPLARAQLPEDERRRFVTHLAQCSSCAADFLELQDFGVLPVGFGQPGPATPAPVPAKPWPKLAPVIQTLKNLVKTSLYSLSFIPAGGVHETGAVMKDATAEYSVLFEDFLDEAVGDGLQASVTAWRTSPTSCDLQVELVDPLDLNRQAGQTVTLKYEGKVISRRTDETGETVFLGLEITRLPSLRIEIEVKFKA